MLSSKRYSIRTLVLLLSGLGLNPALAQKKAAQAPTPADSLAPASELVQVGYTSVKKQALAGAVSVLPGNAIKERTPVSVDALLQGQVAGVRVVPSSGAPGAGALAFIRGAATLNGGALPLYIVDGVPVKASRFNPSLAPNADNNPLADLNPEDIASITVLKDAAATAVYGVRASGGVVLVTTHGGTAGRTYLDFSGYSGLMQAPETVPVFDSHQYRAYAQELAKASGQSDAQINNGIGRYLLLSTPENQKERYNNNTDWQKEVLRNGILNNYHLNLRGGDAVAKYSLNVGYTKQTGAIKESDFSRFSTRFNLDYKVGRKLSFLNTLAYTKTDKTLTDEGNAFNTNPLYLAALKSPVLTAFQQDPTGTNLRDLDSADYAGRNNPYAVINRMSNTNNTNRITGKVIGQYTFSPRLNLRVGIAADYFRLSEMRFRPSAGFVPEGYVIRASSQGNSSELMMLNENSLNYNKTSKSGLHAVTAFVGNAVQLTNQETKLARSINSVSDEFSSLTSSNPQNLDSIGSFSPSWKLLSFFGGGQYAFKGKYIVNASLRADGSSRFAPEQRWGYFPGLAAAWRLGEESFLKDKTFINELKLRASWGITGNQEVGYYNGYNILIPASYSNYSSVRFGSLGNPDFQWEETRQYNAGLDLEAFRGRLGLSLEVYDRQTDNLLNRINLPGISGFTSYAVSEGSVRNRGVELTLTGKVAKGTFGWQTALNAAYNKNTILSLPDKLAPVTAWGNFATIARPGGSIGDFYGYKATGVYSRTSDVTLKNGADNARPFQGGDIIFQNLDGKDDVIDEKDRTVIGNATPDVFGGFTNVFSYKGFDLTVFVDFAAGQEVFNAQRAALESMSTWDNQLTTVNSRWRAEGDVTAMPRALLGDAVGNTRFSSRWIEDGSYARFKAVTLGYNFPLDKGPLKNVFKNARVLVTGQNLYTFSKYKGFSPEVGNVYNPVAYGVDYGNLPQLKTFMLGVRLGL
ncbi:SusC/RagA family TonB-linked outer membrane protein [Paraflavisolibacter sp. H34]|uniref:SusC/RagA family TonB-linked outer membrane protein n=1 Tax=Huijunlia imazamoxiresistens TaxID=3127457 RepID=UPI00301A7424